MKLSEKAYNKLKLMILNNKFHVNQTMLVDDAVEICGYSRTPVREALLRLQEDGLIMLHPRHGLKICALSKRDVTELYEIMGHLEVAAIDLCIAKELTEAQIGCLRDLTAKMEASLNDDDIVAWSEYDREFHETIFAFTGNSRLIETAKRYNEQSKRCKDIVLKIRPKPWESIAEHNLIIDAIRSGDANKARETHLKHWKLISTQFIDFLEKYKFLDS